MHFFWWASKELGCLCHISVPTWISACGRTGSRIRFTDSGSDLANHLQDGEVVDVYLQARRDAKAAKRFFQRFLKAGGIPREIVTDKLRSHGVAHRSLIPEARHNTEQYANNRAELSHQPTRVRERGLRRFKSIQQAQRFLETHAAVYNLFNLHRHSLGRKCFKLFRLRSVAAWDVVTAP